MIGYIISFFVFILGYLYESPIVVNASLIICLANYLLTCILQDDIEKKINPIIFFCIAKILASYGNIMGDYYQDDYNMSGKYWYYGLKEYLYEASLIHVIGALAILLGYLSLQKKGSVFPSLNYQLRDDFLIKYDTFILGGLALYLTGTISIPSLTKFFYLFSQLLIFLYAYQAQKSTENKQFFAIRAYSLTIAMIIVAVYYAYLRMAMVNPAILLLIGTFWGSGKVSSLLKIRYIPLYLFMLIFIFSFNELGAARTDASSKIEIFENTLSGFVDTEDTTTREAQKGEEGYIRGSFVGRASNFNQLTQVIKIQNEDGFEWGGTLEYMYYAWIPRVIWPNKPEIAAGRLFAVRAGLAYVDEQGRVNNSVDMTHPGEMYLNFGYLGVIVGCFLLGVLVSALWNAANFFADLNLTGLLFGGYILSLGYGQFGADFQIVITLLSFYVTCYIIDKVVNSLFEVSKKKKNKQEEETTINDI